MVDTWATVGSCAQIGANVHLSGGVGIGGVLEPPQAAPVIVEDDCLIGSRCMVTQGARVRRGARARRGRDPEPGHPGDRRRDRRGGRPGRRAALVDRRAGAAPARSSRAASSGCRASSWCVTTSRASARQAPQRRPPRARRGHVTDLLALTAELVDIPSVSHDERAITDHLEQLLRAVPWLEVERVGDNVVARTDARAVAAPGAGRPHRHRAGERQRPGPHRRRRAARPRRVRHEERAGRAARAGPHASTAPAVDVTYVFYECEEVEARYNGLNRLLRRAPRPGGRRRRHPGRAHRRRASRPAARARMRVEVTLTGERAHTARAWMGRNAIHRLGERAGASWPAYEPRRGDIDGCEYREAPAGGAGRGRRGRQRGARPGRRLAQPPLRPRPHAGRGRGARALGGGRRRRLRGRRRGRARAAGARLIRCWPRWSRGPGNRRAPSWAGPTCRASPPTASPPPTSGPATPTSRTPRASTSRVPTSRPCTRPCTPYSSRGRRNVRGGAVQRRRSTVTTLP